MNRPDPWGRAIAEDALTLATLHDRELDASTIKALQDVRFPENLGLQPVSLAAQEAWQLARLAVSALPETITRRELDDLAADYAAIYLTGAYGASPCESVWLDEDRLCFQGRMFELRQIYRDHGLANPDGRRRPDDHLTLQFQFIAGLAQREHGTPDWQAMAQHLDEHLLLWLPDFADRVVTHSATAFYAGLAAVTASWCARLRAVITERYEAPRPDAAASPAPAQAPLQHSSSHPGSTPGV